MKAKLRVVLHQFHNPDVYKVAFEVHREDGKIKALDFLADENFCIDVSAVAASLSCLAKKIKEWDKPDTSPPLGSSVYKGGFDA